MTCQRQFIVSGLPIRVPVPLIQQDTVFFLAANKCSAHKLVLKLYGINSEIGFNKQTAGNNKCVTSMLFSSLFITHCRISTFFFCLLPSEETAQDVVQLMIFFTDLDSSSPKPVLSTRSEGDYMQEDETLLSALELWARGLSLGCVQVLQEQKKQRKPSVLCSGQCRTAHHWCGHPCCAQLLPDSGNSHPPSAAHSGAQKVWAHLVAACCACEAGGHGNQRC